jgi:threonine synthase
MDIQVASNFERYLYYHTGQNSGKLRELMDGFAKNRSLSVELNTNGAVDDLFAAGEGNTEQTLATIKKIHAQTGYVLDPHTAVGVAVAERFQTPGIPTICLATAHPAKFPDAIRRAIGTAVHHPLLDALAEAETRCETIANDEAAIRAYLAKKAGV